MYELLDITEYLGLPAGASAHAHQLDFMTGLVHWLMLILFLFWAPFFIYTLIRFRKSRHPVANYEGVRSRASSYGEAGIVVVEALLLLGFALPAWSQLHRDFTPEQQALAVSVIGEQFAWNIHYPGPDGIFGRRDVNLVDTQTNPLGLDRQDPGAKDDIITVNELHLPVDRPVTIHLSSKDVIHSFSLPEMRVKQDAMPGLTIPVRFVPTRVGEYEIACAQLCGLSHYRMRGFLTIHTQEEFEAWLQDAAEEQVAL